jgi:hypothetical protein
VVGRRGYARQPDADRSLPSSAANRYAGRRASPPRQRPNRVENAPARELRLTAIFDAVDPESPVRFLKETNGVAVQQRRREVIVRSR